MKGYTAERFQFLRGASTCVYQKQQQMEIVKNKPKKVKDYSIIIIITGTVCRQNNKIKDETVIELS